MDFGDDGVMNTLTRVIGRRGLGVWAVHQVCGGHEIVYVQQDGTVVGTEVGSAPEISETTRSSSPSSQSGSGRGSGSSVPSTLETSVSNS